MEADGGQRERLGMHDGEALSLCPSFNSYSSGVFAQIAAKVTEESELSTDETPPFETSNELVDDADDFEFAFVRSDEILRGDQFRQIFPVFNRGVLIGSDQDNDDKPDVSNLRISLKNLFVDEREERDPLSSSSSSEGDELEGVPSGSYCVWRPNLVKASPSRCKKSNSTGSASKRWRIRDLLRRSNSEGKDSQSLVLLTPKNKEREHVKIGSPKERRKSGDAVMVKVSSPSAHEVFYVRNRAWKEGDKRKSYLPYRQDLVGFFARMKGVERTFPPY